MTGMNGIIAVDDGDGLVDEVAALIGSTRESLGDHRSALAARLGAESGDDWPPTVVVARPGGASPEALERLAALTRVPGGGTALVALGPLVSARWHLLMEADATAVLEPLGLAVHVAGVVDGIEVAQDGLDEAAVEAACELVAVASEGGDVDRAVDVAAGVGAPCRWRSERVLGLGGGHGPGGGHGLSHADRAAQEVRRARRLSGHSRRASGAGRAHARGVLARPGVGVVRLLQGDP